MRIFRQLAKYRRPRRRRCAFPAAGAQDFRLPANEPLNVTRQNEKTR
jgi:hypothetical protein